MDEVLDRAVGTGDGRHDGGDDGPRAGGNGGTARSTARAISAGSCGVSGEGELEHGLHGTTTIGSGSDLHTLHLR